MKVVFLNVWYGGKGEELVGYIKQQAPDTDVFCFQEADDRTKQLLASTLSNYQFFSAFKFVQKGTAFPQATYVKDHIEVVSSGEILRGLDGGGLALYVELNIGGKSMYVCNFHGIPRPGKLDNPLRLQQSEGLINFFKDKQGSQIIGGDFNILPDTESIRMFEAKGYKDLIKSFGIKSTRNKLAWGRYPDNPLYFSDYIFTSPDVDIKDFQVIDNEISDHLPLILEIN